MHDLFNQCMNHRTFKLQCARIKKQQQILQFMFETVDPKQGDNHAKFEKPC